MPLLLALATAALAETLPPGATIENAASLQVTAEGLNDVAALAPALIPPEIAIGDVGDNVDGSVSWDCLWNGDSGFAMRNGIANVSITRAQLVPSDGALRFTADALISLNSSSNPFRVILEEGCIGDSCSGYIEPFPVTLSAAIGLEVVGADTGAPTLDATIGEFGVSFDDEDLSDAIHIDDCALGVIWDIVDFLTLGDEIIGLIGLEDLIGDLGPELETAIEEAFSAATIQQEIDLNGVPLSLSLFPRDVLVTSAGVEVLLSGSADAPVAACVADWDPNASGFTPTDFPSLSGFPSAAQAGLVLSDDFANQALYALWRGGLLCYELSGDDPLPINTSLLGLLAGDAFDEIFPENRDMIIATRPREVPTVAYDGGHDVVAQVRDLGLNFYAEVDDRMALALGLGLDVDAGVDLPFDGGTGQLGIELALSGQDVTATVVHNELVAGTDEQIEQNFAGVFDSLVGSLLGGLTEGLGFAIPGFEGIGLTDLQAEPAGGGDWLGLYASVGAVSYASGGCTEDGGCDTEGGCDTGCAAGPSPARLFWLGLVPALMARRRRRA